jgi:endogenous inhibitor of DNA gyrase (YacG/DUF329 family)
MAATKRTNNGEIRKCKCCGIEIVSWPSTPRTYCSRRCKRVDPSRFWARVNKTDSCWLWVGTIAHHGYGVFQWDGADVYVHRLSWLIHNGPVPDGLFVCHTCDVRNCVRPDHLFVGTREDNMQDAVAKRRFPWNRRTHCRRGHELSPANLSLLERKAVSKTGQVRVWINRVCRACRRKESLL